jgi:hypothetical protein
MGIGTSKGKFNGLTTAGGGVSFDVGALIGNPKTLISSPDAPSADPEILRFDPDALSRDPDALSCDPDALRFDPDGLRIDPETLRFDVFRQKRGSNGLISSHLREICKNSRKMVVPRCGRAALLRGLGRPAGRPYHGIVSSKPSKSAFPEHSTFNTQLNTNHG